MTDFSVLKVLFKTRSNWEFGKKVTVSIGLILCKNASHDKSWDCQCGDNVSVCLVVLITVLAQCWAVVDWVVRKEQLDTPHVTPAQRNHTTTTVTTANKSNTNNISWCNLHPPPGTAPVSSALCCSTTMGFLSHTNFFIFTASTSHSDQSLQASHY